MSRADAPIRTCAKSAQKPAAKKSPGCSAARVTQRSNWLPICWRNDRHLPPPQKLTSDLAWLGVWFADNDIAIRAIDDLLQFRLLGDGNFKLVERLLEVIHECLPLFGRDVQVLMRLTHRASGIFLWAAARPADHFGNEILEARWRHLVVGFVHGRIRVQARVRHDPVDQIIDNGGDAINSTEALIEGRFLLDLVLAAFLVCHIW